MSHNANQYEDIAIIGMAGRFPDADDLAEFWQNLQSGRDSVQEFPASRKEELKEILGEAPKLDFLREGYLQQISQFEPEIFSINHEECRFMDPQQRLMLELVEEAISDAGYAPEKLAKTEVGVFVAENENLYTRHFYGLSFMAFVNGIQSANAGRIAYTYNFCGPVFTIGTACSSSLVALHAAAESLRHGECEYAITGGIRLDLFPGDKSRLITMPILSPDQKVKAFDKEANGTVIGEGGAILILKPLKKALADGDNIHAIIKASAINSDGSRSSSLNAPSEEGQAEVILKAVAKAGIDPLSISYLETHGTGTKIGDPIEVSGITTALKKLGYANQTVPIGSLKTNIGHLDTASGVASVVKAVLALKAKQIPPSLNFREPNPFIDFETSPIYVNDRLTEWKANTVRRAGVTSLGLIGTNAHVILEEAPAAWKSPESPNLVTLSARTEKSLQEMVKKLAAYLEIHPELSITDTAYTLNTGRRRFPHCLTTSAAKTEELAKKLMAGDYVQYVQKKAGEFSPIFIIPDYTEETLEALTEIFTTEPFQGHLQECESRITKIEPNLLKNRRTQYFCCLYALSQVLESHSIKPGAALGFGMGEIIADLILQDITFEECLEQILNYNKPKEPIEEARLSRVVSSIIEAGLNAFILLSPTVDLNLAFTQALDQALESPQRAALTQVAAASEVTVSSLRPVKPGVKIYNFEPTHASFLNNLTDLLQAGVEIDWEKAMSRQEKRRVSLPGYVFDRKSYYLKMGNLEQGRTLISSTEAAKNSSHSPKSTDPGYISTRITGLLQEFYPDSAINPDLDFDNLGMDSIDLMHFTGKIRQEFDANIPITLFFKEMTIGDTLQEVIKIVQENVSGGYVIQKQPPETYLPMAHAQRVLYQMAQANPAAGHIARAWAIKGGIDKTKLAQAFKAIVERHESIRTSFETVNGEPVQKVHSNVDFQVNYVKANRLNAKTQIRKQVKPFDLTKPPLLRVTLIEAGQVNYLLYEVPYIIVDAASLHLLMDEFTTLYSGGDLPELQIHQKDYVVWQEEQLKSRKMEAKAQYWRTTFSAGINEINLPADYPRPEIFDSTGRRDEYWIKKDLTTKLNQLAANYGVTMNMVLLAAYNILLAKYTGANDITIGSLMGGRSHAELEHLIGHFAFILPLRNEPAAEKTFSQFLNEVKENSLKAFDNQDYPIELLLAEQKISRSSDRGPWFDSTFTYHNMTGRKAKPAEGLKLIPHPLDFWTVVEDFLFILMETDSGIMLDLRYCAKIFKKQTIRRFKDDYIQILQTILANPEIRIGEIRVK